VLFINNEFLFQKAKIQLFIGLFCKKCNFSLVGGGEGMEKWRV
jgi:hypothetical protein